MNIFTVQLDLPIRMSFENKREVTFPTAVIEVIADIFNTVDCMTAFFLPFRNHDGEFVFNRRKVAKSYILSWFFIDCLAAIPYAMFKYYPKDPGANDLQNLIHLNFAYIPRFYVICIAFKLARIRKAKAVMRKLLKMAGFGVSKASVITTLWTIVFILHLIACLLGTAATFNLESNRNWIIKIGIQDYSILAKYLTCLYWASTCMMTVGYGDILPQNDYEILLLNGIFVIGVALFSYSLSSLANQFADLSKSVSKRQSIETQISQLQSQYGLPQSLITKIEFFFSHSNTVISISQDFDIHTILQILPPNLKTRLAIFLYQDAIISIPFFQQRDQGFYLKYLEQLVPMKFQKDTYLLKKDTKPEEIFFILKGTVLNVDSKRVFSTGQVIGETDIIYRRDRVESFIAYDNVYVLKYGLATLDQLHKEFKDIREDLEELAKEREKMRLLKLRQAEQQQQDDENKMRIMEVLSKLIKEDMDNQVENETHNALARKQSGHLSSKHTIVNQLLLSQAMRSLRSGNYTTQKSENQKNGLKPSLSKIRLQSCDSLKSDESLKLPKKQPFELLAPNIVLQHLNSFQDRVNNDSQNQNDLTFQGNQSQCNMETVQQEMNPLRTLEKADTMMKDTPRQINKDANKCQFLTLDYSKKGNNKVQGIEELKSPLQRLLEGVNHLDDHKSQKKKSGLRKHPNEDLLDESIMTDETGNNNEEVKIDFSNQEQPAGNASRQNKRKTSNQEDMVNLNYALYEQSVLDKRPSAGLDNSPKYMVVEPQFNNTNEPENSGPQLLDHKMMKMNTLLKNKKIGPSNHHNQEDMDILHPFLQSPDDHSNIYSSLEMHFNRNIQRIDKIIFIVKKCKLMLNQYYNIFTDYLNKIATKDQDTVPEPIIRTTRQAIKGIEKYLKLLSLLENQIESPREFMDNVDSIRNMISDQQNIMEVLETKFEYLPNLLKPNHLKNLEALLEQQLNQEQPGDMSINPQEQENSFRKQLDQSEELYLKAQESVKERLGIDPTAGFDIGTLGESKEELNQQNDLNIHEYAQLYQLEDYKSKYGGTDKFEDTYRGLLDHQK